jgi:hypothetical protein
MIFMGSIDGVEFEFQDPCALEKLPKTPPSCALVFFTAFKKTYIRVELPKPVLANCQAPRLVFLTALRGLK